MPKTQSEAKDVKQATAAAVKSAKSAKKAAKAAKSVRSKKNNKTAGNAAKVGQRIDSVVLSAAKSIQQDDAAAAYLARAIACPSEFPAFRIQDGYASFPTTAANPFMVEPGSFTTTDGSAADALGVPNDETYAVASPDPRCALRYYFANPGNDFYSYRAVIDGNQTVNRAANEPWDDIQHWESTSTLKPHGDILYQGINEEGHKYVMANDLTTIAVSGLPNTTATTMFIRVLDGEDEAQYFRAETTSGAGSANWLLSDFTDPNGNPPPRMFHFRVERLNQVVSAGAMSINDDGPLICQRALNDYEDVSGIFETMRFNALNLMFSNTAPELYRNGFAAAWQVPSNMSFIALMQAGFESLANKPRAVRMDADEGIHVYRKFSNAADLVYQSVGATDDDEDSDCYKLAPVSDFLFVALKLPVALGRAGYWSIFTCIEARTDSVWFGDDYPDSGRGAFEKALDLMARMPQVHENPLHIKDIFKWVKNHKTRIQATVSQFAPFGGVQGMMAGQQANKFLDTWF